MVKNLPANLRAPGHVGSIPGSGRFLRGGNGSLLQHSCWDNAMDRGGWGLTVDGVAKGLTGLSMHACKKYNNHFLPLSLC